MSRLLRFKLMIANDARIKVAVILSKSRQFQHIHLHSNVQFLNSSVSSIVRRTKYLFASVRFFRYFLTFFSVSWLFSDFLIFLLFPDFSYSFFTSTSICRNAVQSQHRYQIKEINLIGRSQFKFIIYFASPTGSSETIGTTHTCIYKINNRLSRRTNL